MGEGASDPPSEVRREAIIQGTGGSEKGTGTEFPVKIALVTSLSVILSSELRRLKNLQLKDLIFG